MIERFRCVARTAVSSAPSASADRSVYAARGITPASPASLTSGAYPPSARSAEPGTADDDTGDLMDQYSRQTSASTPPNQRSGPPRVQQRHGLPAGAEYLAPQRPHLLAATRPESAGSHRCPCRCWRNDHASHPLLGRSRNVASLFAGVLVSVAKDHGVAAALCDVLHAADHRGEERVADVRNDHRPQRRLPAAQPAGDTVRLVAEGLDRCTHAAHQVRVHRAAAVQHARHRRGRHPRAPRHRIRRRRPPPAHLPRRALDAAAVTSTTSADGLEGADPTRPWLIRYLAALTD
jgi:hypothetical protein